MARLQQSIHLLPCHAPLHALQQRCTGTQEMELPLCSWALRQLSSTVVACLGCLAGMKGSMSLLRDLELCQLLRSPLHTFCAWLCWLVLLQLGQIMS